MQLTGNDVTDIIKSALNDVLAGASVADRQAYLTWVEQMSPIVTQYAVLSAQGDTRAAELLNHIRAQAQAKAYAMAIAFEAGAGIGDIAATAATVAGSILASLIAKYGVVLLVGAL